MDNPCSLYPLLCGTFILMNHGAEMFPLAAAEDLPGCQSAGPGYRLANHVLCRVRAHVSPWGSGAGRLCLGPNYKHNVIHMITIPTNHDRNNHTRHQYNTR
jgi:hypothetical protein